MPSSTAEWTHIANNFLDKWNFPHCIGALDGKHVHIKHPHNTGSAFYNYKGYFSIVLLALVDADYRFIYLDVGANGRNNDAMVYNLSSLSAFMDKSNSLPCEDPLPGRIEPVPYCMVADEIFALKPHLMKPFPGKELDNQK